jgi:hypothetical protein
LKIRKAKRRQVRKSHAAVRTIVAPDFNPSGKKDID